MDATCRYCGATFTQPRRPGRPSLYCRRSHRQRHYELTRRTLPVEAWRQFLEAHGHKCYLCDRPLTAATMTVDHVLPLSRGGPDTLDNLKPCCVTCNLEKASRLVAVLIDSDESAVTQP